MTDLDLFQTAFEEFVAPNSSGGAQPRDERSWEVLSFDAAEGLVVRLTFLAGQSYCCFEPGCHLGLHTSSDWRELRGLFAQRGLTASTRPLVIRLEGVVERGAASTAYPSGHNGASEAYSFDEVFDEAEKLAVEVEPSPSQPPSGFTGVWVSEEHGGSRREDSYVDGVLSGPFRSMMASGVVHREGSYRRGQYHGAMVTRGSDGAVLDRSEFVDGTGIYRIFTCDGELAWEVPLSHGVKHGFVRRRRAGTWTEDMWRHGIRLSTRNPESEF